MIDYSVQLIKNASGLVTIKELEDKMGYSKRYLDMLFKDHLGISPKTYSSTVASILMIMVIPELSDQVPAGNNG